MIENDTISLLQDCDAGVQMSVSSINEVLDDVHSLELRNCLIDCRNKHERLGREIDQRLESRGDEGKEPNPLAKGVSWAKTNLKLAMNDSDKTIADLMTDGCGIGIKALNRSLNLYPAADEDAKEITHRLIALEELLEADLHPYL